MCTPWSRSSCCRRIHTGGLAPGAISWPPVISLSESTVGSHTVLAPSRAAISTASGFMPPTARFSVTAPKTSTPGTTPLTTRARSAVDV